MSESSVQSLSLVAPDDIPENRGALRARRASRSRSVRSLYPTRPRMRMGRSTKEGQETQVRV